jgi:hypothetical protein
MRKILLLLALLSALPAEAADNAILVTPCATSCVTFRSKDVGSGVQSLMQILGDTAGNPLATAPGTPNASFALPMQGVTGGTAVPMSAAALPLPTGAATSALQTTGNTALTTINTTLGTPFQAGGALAANQSVNMNQMGGTAINSGCVSNYGTAPSAVACPSVNAYVTGAVGLAQSSTTSGQTGSLVMAAVTTAAPAYTTAQTDYLSMDLHGGLRIGGAGYPAGATPITASATGTTGATTATLATGASVTTYLCSMSIRANATAAATGNATVTGTITGTLNFTQWTAPLASGLGVTEMIFSPCVPASAVNTGIAVISAAPGTGGVVSVTATGFTL